MVCLIQLAVPSKKKSATKCLCLASVVALVRGGTGALPAGHLRPLSPFSDAGLRSGKWRGVVKSIHRLTASPRACALSPLIGGSLLYHIDHHFREISPDDVFYVRYMDDFLLLARTRWQLRRGIAQLAKYLELSGFERHPEKTQTGRLENGFDWLGFWFGPDGVTPSPRALQNHHDRCLRLFELARMRGASEEEAGLRVQRYRELWKKIINRSIASDTV